MTRSRTGYTTADRVAATITLIVLFLLVVFVSVPILAYAWHWWLL